MGLNITDVRHCSPASRGPGVAPQSPRPVCLFGGLETLVCMGPSQGAGAHVCLGNEVSPVLMNCGLTQDCGALVQSTPALESLNVTESGGCRPAQTCLVSIKCRTRMRNSTSDLTSCWECTCRLLSQRRGASSPEPRNTWLSSSLKSAPSPMALTANE